MRKGNGAGACAQALYMNRYKMKVKKKEFRGGGVFCHYLLIYRLAKPISKVKNGRRILKKRSLTSQLPQKKKKNRSSFPFLEKRK